jgi:hypothetical protein
LALRPIFKGDGQFPSPRFGGFLQMARFLNNNVHRPASRNRGREKGDFQMSGQTTLTRTLIAAVGALVMSTVAVGSAVGPANVSAASVQTSVNA